MPVTDPAEHIDPGSRCDACRPRYDPEVRWDVRIPVRDGLELAANLWLPRLGPGAPGETFPAILEMIPYGKDSWRRNADTGRGEWLAARGFALCRLDVRGTGGSPGVATDEYAEAETLDGSIASDETAFDVRVDLDVRLDGEPFFARAWAERIPCRLV